MSKSKKTTKTTKTPKTKTCATCGERKPAEEFRPQHNTADGLHPHCRPCAGKKIAAGYAERKAKAEAKAARKAERDAKKAAKAMEQRAEINAIEAGAALEGMAAKRVAKAEAKDPGQKTILILAQQLSNALREQDYFGAHINVTSDGFEIELAKVVNESLKGSL